MPPHNLKSMTVDEFLAFVEKAVLKCTGRRVSLTGGRRKSYSMMICWRHSRPKVDIRVNTADEQRSMCAVRTLVAVLKLRKLERNPPVPRLRAGAKCVCDEEMER